MTLIPAHEPLICTLPCLQHIILDHDQVEHLLLRTSEDSVTIDIRGARVYRGPTTLTFQVPGFVKAEVAGRTLQKLSKIIASPSRWQKLTRRQILLRDAAATLDGTAQGATYRDIATAIYGAQRAHAAWSGSDRSLKDKLRYARAVGEKLRAGGYRTLMAAGV